MGVLGDGGVIVMIWRAKVTCQLQGRIIEKGEFIESPEQPNLHFEKVAEASPQEVNQGEKCFPQDLPEKSKEHQELPKNTAEGEPNSLQLTPEHSANNPLQSKNTLEGDQLDEYNRLVDILQENKFSLSDLPDRKKATIVKFLQEKGLL